MVELEELEVRLFLEGVYARYGYDLREYAPESMSRRVHLARARAGSPDLGAFQHAVLASPALFAQVLPDLTVPVSELFRDPELFRAVRERLVPTLRTYAAFNVWHAGCATGEEVYSTAIVLREEGLLERCQIYATDLSPAVLTQAKEGVYRPRDLGAVEERYARTGGRQSLAAHGTIAYGQLAMSEALRGRILFFQHDLVSDHVFAEMTVVFCRNVLIYFSRALRERVLRKLEGSLCPGGFLCLGRSERPPGDEGAFAPFMPEQRIFRHGGDP